MSADIAEAGSTWQEWTGYADEAAYQEACADVFVESLKGGSSRGDLQDLCRAESAATCDEL